jgi:hypothetical protein
VALTIIQKQDLAAASFANTNTNALGGISVRVDAGSTVKNAIDMAIAAIPPGSVAVASDTVQGVVSLAVAANYPSTSNVEATTPAYVNSALAAIPTYSAATDTVQGVVSLAVAANYPSSSNTEAATPAYISAVVATLPTASVATDTVQGISSLAVASNYPSASDAESATPAYVAAAITAIPVATDTVAGKVTLAVTANYPSVSNIEATTPAYVTAAINAIPLATDAVAGTVTLAVAANHPSTSNVEAATPAYVNAALAAVAVVAATDTVAGISSLAVGANFPASDTANSNTEATTPLYVKNALAAQNCVATLAHMNVDSLCTDDTAGFFMFSSAVAPDVGTVLNPWTYGSVNYGGGGTLSALPTVHGELKQMLAKAVKTGPESIGGGWLIAWAGDPTNLMTGAMAYDANGAITTAAVQWPDGGTGVYTATTQSTLFPGSTDAYTMTYVGAGTAGPWSGVTKTVTQPAVTRDAAGRITNRPLRTVA